MQAVLLRHAVSRGGGQDHRFVVIRSKLPCPAKASAAPVAAEQRVRTWRVGTVTDASSARCSLGTAPGRPRLADRYIALEAAADPDPMCMQRHIIACMKTKPVQIRDVPVDALDVMRTRAAAEGMSLAAYLRRMVVEAAAQPTVAEVLARAARRPAGGLTMADIVAATRAGRGE